MRLVRARRREQPGDVAHPGPERTGRLIAVSGAHEPAGVAVIKAVQAAGHRVLALDASPDAVGLRLASRAAVLPRKDQPGYAQSLLAVLDQHHPEALICTVAEDYADLVPLTDRLAGIGVRTWLLDPAATETCLDRVALAAALYQAGVAHPATAWNAQTAALIPGPWVVKPARGRGSRDVVPVDDPAGLPAAFLAVPGAIAQTRLDGREFTADTLVDRDGTLLACVPRWRDETRGGVSVRGTTFANRDVSAVVGASLRAVGLTGPSNVRGFVAERGIVTIVEVNPRFSGGLPLSLAAGADLVGTYLAGILDPGASLPGLTYQPGVRMARYFAEVYQAADGRPVADPLALGVIRP